MAEIRQTDSVRLTWDDTNNRTETQTSELELAQIVRDRSLRQTKGK